MKVKVPASLLSDDAGSTAEGIGLALMDFVSTVPLTTEPLAADPHVRASSIVRKYCWETAGLDFALALPPGPLNWLTLVPSLITVWRLQAQMISDIAACYGKYPMLRTEQMIYCLFRHATGHLMRDIVTRVGSRFLIRKVALKAMQSLLRAIGLRITQKVIGRGLARTIPLLGAAGIAAYAFYDTSQVGKTAIELLSREHDLSDEELAQFD